MHILPVYAVLSSQGGSTTVIVLPSFIANQVEKFSLPLTSLQPLIKPNNRLLKRLLLRKPPRPITQIRPNRKPMLDATIQTQLIRHAQLLQHILALPPLLRRENRIRLRRRNRQGSLNSPQFRHVDEARMRGEAHIDTLALSEESTYVLAAETVAHGPEPAHGVRRPQLVDHGRDHGVYGRGAVAGWTLQPGLEVETGGPV